MRYQTLFGYPQVDDEIVNCIPYMGSKRVLANQILNAIYETVGDFEHFYDCFGGGGALSVAALQAGHSVTYNELNKGVASLMKHLINGGKIPLDWVSREQFHELKLRDD